MDLLQGTLDMLVLRTLLAGSLHGYGIAKTIRSVSHEALDIEFGSLYPALKRLEAKGWIASAWETSEHNRRAKFYKLTAAGRKHLGTGTLEVGRLRERGRTDHGTVAGGERMTIRNRLKYLWPAWRRREEREMREELGALTAMAGAKELGNLTLAMEDVRATWGWTWLGKYFRGHPLCASARCAGSPHSRWWRCSHWLSPSARTARSSASPTRCCCGPCRWNPAAVLDVSSTTPDNPFEGMSFPDYRDLRDQSRSFSGLAAYRLTAPWRPPPIPRRRRGCALRAW
jgi:PadR family transcriptional regulator, regulatory protein PadR